MRPNYSRKLWLALRPTHSFFVLVLVHRDDLSGYNMLIEHDSSLGQWLRYLIPGYVARTGSRPAGLYLAEAP